MNLYAFRARQGNFGDDLNAWLWPKVLGPEMEMSPGTTLIGIGSVLDHRVEQVEGYKIVFGSGIRSTRYLPKRSADLHIKFVRGPISAAALGNATRFITDPAVLVGRATAGEASSSTHMVGFMPHYHSLEVLDWAKLCARVGMLLIDPRDGVDQTLAKLSRCDRIISEAMHGAIVADSLRIPWHRVSVCAWRKEGFDVSSLKWLDWGLSMNVDVTPTHLGLDFVAPSSWGRRLVGLVLHEGARRKLTRSLAGLRTSATYQLSADRLYESLLGRVDEQINDLRRWLSGNSR